MARNARARLQRVHEYHHHGVDQHEHHRHRDERFIGLGGVIDQLPALRGELQQADGGSHGGILEDIEKLRGQWRQDDTNRHRQYHVAIGLRQRKAQRQTGILLSSRKRIDSGANLLAHPGAGKQSQAQHRGQKLLQKRVDRLVSVTD